MKSGSWSSYVAAGALGERDGPDLTPEEFRAIEDGRAAQDWIDDHMLIWAGRMRRAGIVNCCDLHGMLAEAFRAGARHGRGA